MRVIVLDPIFQTQFKAASLSGTVAIVLTVTAADADEFPRDYPDDLSQTK